SPKTSQDNTNGGSGQKTPQRRKTAGVLNSSEPPSPNDQSRRVLDGKSAADGCDRFGVKTLITTCQAMANAPMINTTSPNVRIQRRVSRKPCCRNSSLRAYHMPVLTLAWNWNKPTGSKLVMIISTRPALSHQKPVLNSLSFNGTCGRI